MVLKNFIVLKDGEFGMKKLFFFLLSLIFCFIMAGCNNVSYTDQLIKCSSFTNSMSNENESLILKNNNKFDYFNKYSNIDLKDYDFEEIYDYEYEYYVHGEVFTAEVHKRNDHIKVYLLKGLTKKDKPVYFIYDNEKHDLSEYSYYKVSLFATNENITSSLLDSYRKELEKTVVSVKGKVDTDWKLYHYIKNKNYIPIDSVTMNYKSCDIGINETIILEAIISPRLTTDQLIYWEVDDEKIVEIVSTKSLDGKYTCEIKGLTCGDTNVYFRCADGKTQTIPIAVKTIEVESISISISFYSSDSKIHPNTLNTIYANFPFQLHAYVNPKDATHDKIKWNVNDSSILSTFEPNSDGSSISIKAKEAGNIVVTANVGDISESITLTFINHE